MNQHFNTTSRSAVSNPLHTAHSIPQKNGSQTMNSYGVIVRERCLTFSHLTEAADIDINPAADELAHRLGLAPWRRGKQLFLGE